MTKASVAVLSRLATTIRVRVLEMVNRAGSSHVGSAFSTAEIMSVLYGSVMRVDPQKPNWSDRDRFILSKGHAASALYAVLGERGFFDLQRLEEFGANGSPFVAHCVHGIPGVEASTGSLGHGLSLGCGRALVGRWEERAFRVFVLLSDGECDEGAVWEAALFAAHHGLDNLVAIIDYNKIQSLGRVAEVVDLEPLAAKWRAFGWATSEVNGHDPAALRGILENVPTETGRPTCVVAHTVKGKGVSFMEDDLLWHYRSPQGDEYERARAELERE